MRRREFIAGLGGAAAWPVVARAQQPAMPVVGFLSSLSANDATRITAAFYQGLNETGYVEGRNVALEFRWAEGRYERLPAMAAELVRREVAVIAAISGTPAGMAAKSATTSIPIVFAIGGDPVEPGLVTSLSRGGNATGFALFEYSIGAKWLELLKEIAPRIVRVAVIRDPALASGAGLFGVIQSAAPSLGVEVSPINVHDAGDIERAVGAFARGSNGGLIVTPNAVTAVYRGLVVTLAAQYKLPAMFWERFLATDGGLMSYGSNAFDQYRHAAGYVDRILKGEKPANLPVQTPTKYELVINLKTAKALGIEVPHSLLARADEVIE